MRLGRVVLNQNKRVPGVLLNRKEWRNQAISTMCKGEEDGWEEAKEYVQYLNALTNYEKSGVPQNAGTDSEDGLDLGRMRRLLYRLGDPHSSFKAVHIAGTKGKGSTAAFISSILRAEGYSVGCYTSPHLLSMRERMTLGKTGDPVSAEKLSCLFRRIKPKLDKAIEAENGNLTHFEVLTATAYTLFADENVDLAVIEAGLGGARDATNVLHCSGLAASVITTIGEEHLLALGGSLESVALAKAGIIKHGRPLVMGGPFLPHIEHILRDKASVMRSPVISASDAGVRTTIKGIDMIQGRPCQFSDLKIRVEADFHLFLELSNLKLWMLGSHQLQNAATAACTALCLRNQGWGISDESIRIGLENTFLIGRSHYLSSKEADMLGLPGATILLDGAHTKESAKALVETTRMTFTEARVALVVAMANDKDHSAFAKEFLKGVTQLAAVFLTEADIADGKSRTTPASFLRDRWVRASKELGVRTLESKMDASQLVSGNDSISHAMGSDTAVVLVAENSLQFCMRAANHILRGFTGKQSSLIVVTGSLHVVSSVLASLHH